MTGTVIVRGDDAGLCPGVNRAIEEAVRRGPVRNVSFMVPAPAFADAVNRLGGLPVDRGVHLTLNSEWTAPRWRPILPASEVPSLVDEHGWFRHDPHELHARGIVVAEAVAEARAQIVAARAAGLRLHYVDEHMGVGWLPGLRAALLQLCRAEGLIAAEEFASLAGDGELLSRVRSVPDGTHVLVTHPGHDEPTLRAMHLPAGRPGTVARERDAERRALIDGDVTAALERQGIRIGRYTSATAAAPGR